MLKRLIRARLSQTQQKTEITRSAVDCYSTEIFRFHSIFGFSTWIIKHSSHHQLPVDKEQQLGRESASLGKNMEKVIVSELILNWSCIKDFIIFITQRVGCFGLLNECRSPCGGSLQSRMILSPIYPVNTRYLNPRSIKPIRKHTELISTMAKRRRVSALLHRSYWYMRT